VRPRLPPGPRITTAGFEFGAPRWSLYQVSEKLPFLIAGGFAFRAPLVETMVIGSIPGVELERADSLTLALLNPMVPKSASGSTPPLLDGRLGEHLSGTVRVFSAFDWLPASAALARLQTCRVLKPAVGSPHLGLLGLVAELFGKSHANPHYRHDQRRAGEMPENYGNPRATSRRAFHRAKLDVSRA
jgi:hypothetical protein